ncbi:MAG: PilZ domain-containing protein [bacterium]|jgi:hypothetical protein
MIPTRASRKESAERRRAPRAAVEVPVKIKQAKGVIEASTKNISASGAYCMLNTFVPLNAELGVTLLIPREEPSGQQQLKKLKCHGIVVRNEAERETAEAPHYGMAICFTDLGRRDERELKDYVKNQLPPDDRKRLARMKNVDMRYDPGEVFSTKSRGGRGFSVSSANFRVLGQQINLSKNGICCQTDRSIPLFREIAVNLVLPPTKGAGGGEEPEALQCSAVVVGCEKVPRSDRYDMAAYFVGLSKEQKKRLEDCIEKFL